MWTEDVAQAVEYLLCKCEAPSSNPYFHLTNKRTHGFGGNF
jgi:hypothetical protein